MTDTVVSVVCPVYFNADTLEELLARLKGVAAGLPDLRFEFVLVDDGSGDASYQILRRSAAEDPRVRLIRLSRNFGSNLAILAGLTHAQGDAVVVIAADLQDPPEIIPELVAKWRSGAEMVLAVRRTRDDPPLTAALASVFNRLFRSLVFPDFPRNGFDFMLVTRRVARLVAEMAEKNSYIFGQLLWLGFEKALVPYDRVKRPRGSSRWTFLRKLKYFIDAFTAFSYLPVRAASFTGFVLAILGFGYATLVLVKRLTHAIPVPGFSALMIVVLISGGVQLIVAGITGEYLWRVLEETRRRPPFVIAETVNLPSTPPAET